VKQTIRELTRASRGGWSMEERIRRLRLRLQGWVRYFALTDTMGVFEELDEWLRRRLRIAAWGSGSVRGRGAGS